MIGQPGGGLRILGINDDIPGAFTFGFHVLRENAGKRFGGIASPDDGAFTGLLDRPAGAGSVDSGMNLTADHRTPLAGIGVIGASKKIHESDFEHF